VYAPVITENKVAVFGRDLESSQQVWSSKVGYPGHSDYREFYRDIGFDLDFDYIRPYIHPDGIRMNTGIKYYRITGNCSLQEKASYCFEKAAYQAVCDAHDFVEKRRAQILKRSFQMRIPPVVVSPYDAELFGHWWYEGPLFITEILDKVCKGQSDIGLITPSEYLEKYGPFQPSQPSDSTWGAKGYNEVWLEESNEWIYRHLTECARKMISLAKEYPNESGFRKEALDQLARELLLAQSSDWAFIMKTKTTVEYADKRTRVHIDRFNRIYNMFINNNIDASYVKEVFNRDNIFADLDYRVYIPREDENF
jgi:1,4-alpha-glucan branching enzyme